MAARKSPGGGKGQDKIWSEAVRLAVNEVRKGPTGGRAQKILRQLARKLVDRALDGDIPALKEIGDRLDGKPTQSLGLSGTVGMTHEQALDELEK